MYFRIRVPTNEDTLIIGQNASPLLPTAGCGSDQAMAANHLHSLDDYLGRGSATGVWIDEKSREECKIAKIQNMLYHLYDRVFS